METDRLTYLGWNTHFESIISTITTEGLAVGRIHTVHGRQCTLLTPEKTLEAVMAGRLMKEIDEGTAYHPATGDWVLFAAGSEPAVVRNILPRQNALSRKAAGIETTEQTLAANLSTVFLCMGMDRDFNPRRLERYLTLARTGGVFAAIVLTKADLAENPAQRRSEIQAFNTMTPVFSISALCNEGLEDLQPFLGEGETIALLGSSGCGKSTLLNALAGGILQKTGEVRSTDGRGRHTTTARSIFTLPSGALVIDTPGLREVGLWSSREDMGGAFPDIEALTADCRFTNCSHTTEPGCAVLAALEEGSIDRERYESYIKLMKELGETVEGRLEKKRQWEKSIAKEIRRMRKLESR